MKTGFVQNSFEKVSCENFLCLVLNNFGGHFGLETRIDSGTNFFRNTAVHFGNGVCTTNLTRRSWRILSKLTFGQINMKMKMLMNLKMVLMVV